MATHRISIFGPMQNAPARKAAGLVRLAPTVKNDVFLNALLEMPTTQQAHRSPLEWAGAMALHIVIVAALIIVPLYTTGTIRNAIAPAHSRGLLCACWVVGIS